MLNNVKKLATETLLYLLASAHSGYSTPSVGGQIGIRKFRFTFLYEFLFNTFSAKRHAVSVVNSTNSCVRACLRYIEIAALTVRKLT